MLKTSIELPDEMYSKLKEYNSTHKDRPINLSGVVQDYLEKTVTGKQKQPDKSDKNPNPEIITDTSLSLEAMCNKWWEDKQIGRSIINAGGIGLINLTNIIQKNPDLFKTKEECRAWLYNKLKTEPPVIEKIPLISNKQRKLTAPNTVEEPPKFTPNRTTHKCPGCGEEQLIILGSPVKRCVNCGHPGGQENSTKPQSDQQAQAQNNPPPPPTESP